MRYPNIYFLALLACLIIDCISSLVTVLSLFARFMNLFHPSMLRRLLKTSSFAFILISSSQRSITLLALLLFFLKIACLHVCFTAYEIFCKLSKMHCLLFCFPLSFQQKYQKSEILQSNIYPFIHCFIHP